MRFAIMHEAILADDRLGLRDIRVLMALRLWADKNGECHPTREQLSEMTGYPIHRISAITRNLAELGWLAKAGNGGRGMACDYKLSDIAPDRTVTDSVTVTKTGTVTDSGTVISKTGKSLANADDTRTESVTVTDSETVTVLVTGKEQTNKAKHTPPFSSPPSQLSQAAASPQPQQRKPERGTRLPDDWTLPDDWRAWAEDQRPELDADTEADKFRDYWIAKTGQGATKRNWLATWRNWIRNAKVNHGYSTHQATRKLSASERAVEAERRGDEYDRRMFGRSAPAKADAATVEPDGGDLRAPLDGEFWRSDNGGRGTVGNGHDMDEGAGRFNGRRDTRWTGIDDTAPGRMAANAAGVSGAVSCGEGHNGYAVRHGIPDTQGATGTEGKQGNGGDTHPVDARLAAIRKASGVWH